jgi:hypothetical protein
LLLLFVAAATVWTLGPGGTTTAQAEPVFSVRTGYSCGQCHVNRTGGGMRTAFGSLYGQVTLPARLLRWREEDNLLPANPDSRFWLGGDARFAYIEVDSADGDDVSSFEIPEANLYGLVRLFPQRLVFYVDQTLGPGGSFPRELFGLFSFRRGTGYVKLGKFLPPYGWRLPDDKAFIREPLGFAFSAPDIGIEAGIEPGKWSVHLAAVNGSGGATDTDRSKKLSLLTMRRLRNAQIGFSAAYDDISDGPTITLAGLLGGVNLGRLALLAEGDWRRSRSDEEPTSVSWVGFFEANLLVTRGMNLKYAHDWTDPNRDARTDSRQRDSLGFEYIPYPFVQLRAFVRRKDGPPQVPGSRDNQLDLEVHLYF